MNDVYAVIAYIARYWFVALMLVILWRALHWLRRDARRTLRARRRLPDAGYIGEWALVDMDTARVTGEVIAAPRDGWLGSGRGCDVCLRHADMPACAARFFLRDDGLHLVPLRGVSLCVDGQPVRREAILRHGATVSCGAAALQLLLFAGVELKGEKRGRKPHKPVEPVLPEMPEDEVETLDAPEFEPDFAPETESEDVFFEEATAEDMDAPSPSGLPQPTLKIRTKGKRKKPSDTQAPHA